MSWNDIAYNAEPSPAGVCVLKLQFDPSVSSNIKIHRSLQLYVVNLHLNPLKWIRESMHTHTLHNRRYSTNGWNIQAPGNRRDQSTHRNEVKREAEHRACSSRTGWNQGEARFRGLRSGVGAEP